MKNILLIDDDEVIQVVLMKALQKSGYNVVIGSDGAQGLLAIEQQKFDLIISDIMMPYLNGFEFIEALKTHKNTSDAKVMIISSITHQDSINSSKTMGVDQYFPKPILIDNFLETVNQLLS